MTKPVGAAEYAAMVAKRMTEAQLQTRVLELAKTLGWLAYHTYDSRRSQAGFPDLVLVRGRRLVFAELKSERGRLSHDQTTWMQALGAVAFDFTGAVSVHQWRPSDWLDDSIRQVLQ